MEVNSRSDASRPLRAFYIRYQDGYVQYYAETPDEAAQILAKIQWVRENRGEDRPATSRSSSSRSLLLHESSYERVRKIQRRVLRGHRQGVINKKNNLF